jgi:hypothetical protein
MKRCDLLLCLKRDEVDDSALQVKQYKTDGSLRDTSDIGLPSQRRAHTICIYSFFRTLLADFNSCPYRRSVEQERERYHSRELHQTHCKPITLCIADGG